ncbi:MAG: hypothetical protein JST87_19675 [Bacteroidetes bacterium]|nr:hypothetical protein [Bacteroidota bacterium]MBS1933641.1 hypothetical protein [Bacteroidota bacterium]
MGNHFAMLTALLLLSVLVFAQPNNDSLYRSSNSLHKYEDDSTFSVLFNISTVFTTAKDPKINNFLTKYGYHPPQNIPVGINLEIATIPFNSKMMYSLQGGTIISTQDIVSAHFTLGAYRRFVERKHFWFLAGLGLGTHGDRVVLDGNMPESFDSLAKAYNKLLSLHRTGFLVEPAARFFWNPIQTKKIQLGLFAGTAYDFGFNTKWKLGYFKENGQFTSFKRIRNTTNVQTQKEFGWAFTDGISFCFKFD